MKCPHCSGETPPRSDFCIVCGRRLGLTCASCATELPSHSKFCHRCGVPVPSESVAGSRIKSPESYIPRHLAEQINTSRASIEGERKQVTVLFADMKGSMELLAERDPEEAGNILDPVLERMMEAVHRFEGTVNQVMGDGIMALFGAPVAHEDHAIRACYAALRIRESVNSYAEDLQRTGAPPVYVRVGVNSGEVVVRSIGNDLRMDYTAIGQTVHLAARMEQIAKPGSILITGETLRMVEGYIAVRSLGPILVKGLNEAVDAYEVTNAGAVRTRLQRSAARGFTRFVGRADEMTRLQDALDQAKAGHGRVVAVGGEPGVGKSRLLFEFLHSHRTDGCLILESGTAQYRKTTPYLPIVDLLHVYFQIEAWDDSRRIREKISGKLATLDESLMTTLPVFLALMDAAVEEPRGRVLEVPLRRQQTIEACQRLFLCESRVEPFCLVIEDLHWTDSETQAFIEALIEQLPSARILLLVSYRPEHQAEWISSNQSLSLWIDPLPPASAEALLTALLGDGQDLQPLKRMLIGLTNGNPFFIEETVRNLVETDVLAREGPAYRMVKPLPTIPVPSTVQAVLAARVDRLGAAEKTVLQIGSVIGNTMSFALLQAIANKPEEEFQRLINRLMTAEFISPISLFPELEYSFKHALTHEVVYEGLLHEHRRRLHVGILGAIERLYADRLPEHIERLAYHAYRGQLWEQAVTYLGQAGRKAAALSALQDARTLFEQALEAVSKLPPSVSTLERAFQIRLELRPVLNLLGEVRQALERLREAEGLAEQLDDDRRRGQVSAFMTNVHALIGELDEALASGSKAVAIARALEDLDLRITATTYLAHAHYLRGEYAWAVDLTTDNLAALPAERVHDFFGGTSPPAVYDRMWLVMSLAQLGRFAEATAHASEAIRLAAPMQHAFTLGVAYRAASTLAFLRGDWAQARALIERWLSVVRTGNVVLQLPRAVVSSAWVLARFGETSEALNSLREGEQLLERHAARGLIHSLGWDYYSLGRAYLLLGRIDEARVLGERAVEFSSRHPGFAAHSLHLLGDVATYHDRVYGEVGEALYTRARVLADQLGMRPLVAQCHLGLGRLHARTNRSRTAREHVERAISMHREMDMPFWLVESEEALKRLL